MATALHTYINPVLGVALAAVLLSACAGDNKSIAKANISGRAEGQKLVGAPGWVLGREHPEFPVNRFIVGVGMSDRSPVQAGDSARAELAKSLRVKISSRAYNQASETSERMNLQLESGVEAVLEGVQIRDGWSQAGWFFALAVLDRGMAAKSLRERHQRKLSESSHYVSRGRENISAGAWGDAMNDFHSAYGATVSAEKFYRAVRLMELDSGRDAAPPLAHPPENIATQIEELLQDMKLSVVSGESQTAVSADGLAEDLVVRVARISDGRPLQGVPLSFAYSDGEGRIEADPVSRVDGTARARVRDIKPGGLTRHGIAVRVALETLGHGRGVSPVLRIRRGPEERISYALDFPSTDVNEPVSWKDGILRLAGRLVQGLSGEDRRPVRLVPFEDLRSGKRGRLSRILLEDLQSALIGAGAQVLHPAASADSSHHDARPVYEVAGTYRLDRNALEIRARLVDSARRIAALTVAVSIDRSEIHPDDLAEMELPVLMAPVLSGTDAIPLAQSKSNPPISRPPSDKTGKVDKVLPADPDPNRTEKSPGDPVEPEKTSNLNHKPSLGETSRPVLEIVQKMQDSPPEGRRFGPWIVYDTGTALDTRSNLMWMQADFFNLNRRAPSGYDEALDWAAEMNRARFAGFGDWRLPTADEYRMIFDPDRARTGFRWSRERGGIREVMHARPVGYPRVFEDGGGYWFWTAEEDVSCARVLSAPCYRAFSFRDGMAGAKPAAGADVEWSSVRLVRRQR